MSTDIYRRLLNLLPTQPLQMGTVAAIYPDGSAQVTLLGGGGELRVLNPGNLAANTRVFVRGDSIIGTAPNLPYEEGEI